MLITANPHWVEQRLQTVGVGIYSTLENRSKEPMNLLKSLAAVSSMTMFSRVLGFARDAIVARVFGAGMATDAFLWHLNCLTCCGEYLLKAHFPKLLCLFWLNTKASKGRGDANISGLCLWPVNLDIGGRHRRGDAGRALGDLHFRPRLY